MVGPVGNTELGGRWRRVDHLQVAYEEAIASSSHFRESAAPYRPARSGRNFAYGVFRSEIRARTAVHGPLNTAKEKRGAVSRLSLENHFYYFTNQPYHDCPAPSKGKSNAEEWQQ